MNNPYELIEYDADKQYGMRVVAEEHIYFLGGVKLNHRRDGWRKTGGERDLAYGPDFATKEEAAESLYAEYTSGEKDMELETPIYGTGLVGLDGKFWFTVATTSGFGQARFGEDEIDGGEDPKIADALGYPGAKIQLAAGGGSGWVFRIKR